MKTNPLPCPFCGGAPYPFEDDTGMWVITCENCDAESGLAGTEADAVAVWNRRITKCCCGKIAAFIQCPDCHREDMKYAKIPF